MSSCRVADILDFMWELAPKERAESWDNVGLLVGRSTAPVNTILCALDVTKDVIAEAKEKGAELIVSHHPLIFDTHKHVTDTVFQQDKVLSLAEAGIAAICMHTNFDEAVDGVDDTLVETLGLCAERHLGADGIGHVCLPLEKEMALADYLPLLKEKLGANGLRYADAGRPVRKIATGCGACGDYLEDAVRAGCDTFITGDIKYNVFQDALGMGINLIDAGHYPTENPIIRKLAGKLSARFPEIRVMIAESIAQPDRFFI